jgi:homoserine dehydrogenase
MELKLAFAGFGNVAREFVRLLETRQKLLAEQYGITWRITGIATATRGCVISSKGLPVADLRQNPASLLKGLADAFSVKDSESLIDSCDADILFETTPLNHADGEPAATYIRKAFRRGIHLVTANKGPIACAYQELKTLAEEAEVQFRFEGTVMDGLPIFNLQEYCLPAVTITGFSGILNSTTNYILTGMEAGRPFAECLAEAQRLGIAEANADYDIDGWDAAVKAVALANVLMNAKLHPRDVQRQGIRGIRRLEIEKARQEGKVFRLVASAWAYRSGVQVEVAPKLVALDAPFANLQGTSSHLILVTDLMGEIALVEHHPHLTQTAYALLSDMIRIHENMARRSKSDIGYP